MKGWHFDPARTLRRLRESRRKIEAAISDVESGVYAAEAAYRVDSEAGEVLDKAKSTTAIQQLVRQAIEQAHGDEASFVYVMEWWPDSVVYELESDAGTILLRRKFRVEDATVSELGDPVEVERVYRLVESADPTESRESAYELAIEALGDSGTAQIKLIQAGQGSSGFYSPETLQAAAGPSGAFPAGTKMHWNHPTPTEERERPERSLDTLAGELTGPAEFRDGALWAPAKIFKPFREAVRELKDSIGVSIRALVDREQSSEGPQIKAIIPDAINSVDFVTLPGAGGEIVAAFESWGRGPQPIATETEKDMENEALEKIQEALAGISKTLTAHGETLKRVDALDARLGKQEIREAARAAVEKADLPEIAKTRVVEALVAKPPRSEDGSLNQERFTAAAVEAIAAESDYIKQLGPGKVVGMGADPAEPAAESADDELAKSYEGWGLPADQAARVAGVDRAKEVN